MSLAFNTISYAYDGHAALSSISLTCERGEIVCLLGPSGCGKTTLLNLAAGILNLQAGEINLDGQLMASKTLNPPPEKRPIGLVFQDGALFPHMNVRDNIQFGMSKSENKDALTAQLLKQVGLPGYEARFPHTLSGGQQQRVAVARALAAKPAVLLMDEPFASIDIALRRRLRADMRRALKANDGVSIIVTHDPEEAMEIADKIAVMDQGRIIQFGTPFDLYQNPQSLSVAKLTGNGTSLPAKIDKDMITSAFGTWPLESLSAPLQDAAEQTPRFIELYARAFSFNLRPAKDPHNALTIIDIRRTGPSQMVLLQNANGEILSLSVQNEAELEISQAVELMAAPKSLIAFNV